MSLSLLFSFFLFGSWFVWFPLSSASVASDCGVLSPLLSGFSSLCLVPSPLWVLLIAPFVCFCRLSLRSCASWGPLDCPSHLQVNFPG